MFAEKSCAHTGEQNAANDTDSENGGRVPKLCWVHAF